jgi:hypothetical protein
MANRSSDKWGSSFDDMIDTDVMSMDINKEFTQSSLYVETLIFNRFSMDDIRSILESSGVFRKLNERGYIDHRLEIVHISDLDNRIYIKNKDKEILVHIRLKLNDFFIKKLENSFKMMYIDWLLTQNIRLGKLKEKKRLFHGQEYPGLNIFAEITTFITELTQKIGAHGVFNVPEYFHDAVLFHKNFKFVDPKKEGEFRTLIETFKKSSLRELSLLIHSGLIYDQTEGLIYQWKYGEMLYTGEHFLEENLFGSEYYEAVKFHQKKTFVRLV